MASLTSSSVEKFADHVVATVKSAIDPVVVRLWALEQRAPLSGRDGLPGRDGVAGKDADPELVKQLQSELATIKAELGVRTPAVRDVIADALKDMAARVEALEQRAPVDGKDGKDADLGLVKQLQDDVSSVRARLDTEEFPAMVAAEVAKAVAAIQRAQDGAPGPVGPAGADGESGQDGAIGPIGPPGPVGDPGAVGTPGTDGKPGEMGIKGDVGPQGEGIPGRDGLPGVQGPAGFNGKDGIDGMHGKDGLGFDDLKATYDDRGRMSLEFIRGDVVKSFRVPSFQYQGVFKDGDDYDRGDSVSWGGHLWIAKQATTVKPDSGKESERHWQMAVRRGKDGTKGLDGAPGVSGKDGKDGVVPKW